MEWISSPEAWIALLTLTVLETVLGIDNIIFVAILAERVQSEIPAVGAHISGRHTNSLVILYRVDHEAY